jgi:hypothetical protein
MFGLKKLQKNKFDFRKKLTENPKNQQNRKKNQRNIEKTD